MERRLSAIMVADMVGFSRLMEIDETSTIARQKAHRADLIDPALGRHGGRVVKTTGDGLLVEFPSVVEAVSCAVAIQREMPNREPDIAPDIRIQYRIGINLGDVMHEDGDIHGDGVNVAARLEQIAPPGGICISGSAYDQLRSTVEAGYQDLGEVQVKNISRPIRAWRVLLEPDQVGTVVAAPFRRGPGSMLQLAIFLLLLLVPIGGGVLWWDQRPEFTPADPAKYAFELPEKPSIAVLAFDNLTGDAANDYIGDGLSENIIATLATLPKLFVIARNSSFHYKGTATPVQTIAEELGVRYVLEGSVQKSGDKIRVTAQLIDALDGRHMWAKTYDRVLSVSDMFAIQDDISQDIALTLDAELISGDMVRSYYEDIGNMETIALVYGAVAEFQKFTPESNQLSEQLLLKALRESPNSSIILLNLGWATWNKVPLGLSSDPVATFALARDYVNRSLQIDPDNAYSYSLLAWLDMYGLDYKSALKNAEKTVDLSPGGGVSVSVAGWVYAASGYPERGVELLQIGMRTQPFFPDWIPYALVRSLMMLSRYEEATALAEIQMRRSNPTITIWLLHQLAIIAVQQGDIEMAKRHVAKALELRPGASIAEYLQANYFLRDVDLMKRGAEALRTAGLPENPPPKPTAEN